MLYSFKVFTEPLADFTRFILESSGRLYPFVMAKGDREHYYLNVPMQERPVLYGPGPQVREELSFGKDPFTTLEQEDYDDNQQLTSEGDVKFRVVVRGEPTHAIVMFPPYRGNRGFAAPYGVVAAEKFGFDDCLYISFQDPYFANGSYMLATNSGLDPRQQIVGIIRKYLASYSLSDSEVTMIGSSKGANIAALISPYFDDNQLILSGYATDIRGWVAHNGQASLISSLDYYGIDFPDALSLLRFEGSRKETHWFYSVGDDLANGGHEDLSEPNLLSYACQEPHGTLFRDRWDQFEVLIGQRIARMA